MSRMAHPVMINKQNGPPDYGFVSKGVNVYPEEQAKFGKTSFVLAMQRLLASARALTSEGSRRAVPQ